MKRVTIPLPGRPYEALIDSGLLKSAGEHIARVGVIVGELHERLVDATEFYGFLRQHGFRVVAKWPAHHSKDHHMFEVARVVP